MGDPAVAKGASDTCVEDGVDSGVVVVKIEEWLDRKEQESENLREAVFVFREVLWNGLRVELANQASETSDLILRFSESVNAKTFAQTAEGLNIHKSTALRRYELLKQHLRADREMSELLRNLRGASYG